MYRQYFKCTLRSDIVLSSKPASEGFNPSLDYIPGIKFLGIAASKLYQDDERSIALFHSGKLIFGDGNQSIHGQRSLKFPLAWYRKKGVGMDEPVWIYHSPAFFKDTTPKEQLRSGYFSESGAYVNHYFSYSIKSAYDPKQRRAKDNQMYGYHAMRSGQEFVFFIQSSEDSYFDLVKPALEGDQLIGRSRSAQYGRVFIARLGEPIKLSAPNLKKGLNTIYVESDLCLIDKQGQPSFQPLPEDLGLPPGSMILREKCQVRTRVYTPWNDKRKTYDTERYVIEKGSVFVASIPNDSPSCSGVYQLGAHAAEGLGMIRYNPDFLEADENGLLKIKLHEHEEKEQVDHLYCIPTSAQDDDVISFLRRAHDAHINRVKITRKVNDFKRTHGRDYPKSEIKSSQWGTLYKLAMSSVSFEDFDQKAFEPHSGYLHHGVNKNIWMKKDRAKNLQGVIKRFDGDRLVFARLLVVEMAKAGKGDKQ